MKTRLFENVGGNKFKLLTENTNVNESHVTSGVKKVFMNAGGDISFQRIEAVGMGYIKDINTAKRVALDEARILAKEYGYKEDEDTAKFTKEETQVQQPSTPKPNPETNMNNPEEKEEVNIGKQMLAIIEEELKFDLHPSHEAAVAKAKTLAEQLIKMHGQQ